MEVMNRYLLPVLAGLLAVTVSAPVLAWGGQGHRLVADVAATRLSPAVDAEVRQLLALEGHARMADVASWADELRAHDPELGKRSAGWHYVNIAAPGLPAEANCHYEEAAHCHDRNCVVAALEDQSTRLADRSLSPAERLEALKFVIHLVGDVHQPMHAGYAHDKGGNERQLRFQDKGTNLHALWDSGMLRSRGLDDAGYLARLLEQPSPATGGDARTWAEASCRIAITPGVYPEGRHIGEDYLELHLPEAEARLRAAGEELARLLNTLLAPAAGTDAAGP